MATFIGLPGADNFDGTDDDDVFKLFQGGSDTANGHGGVDLFIMRDQLDAGDTLNGGGGDDDTVRLEGDYSAGLVFGADTITNIERLELKGAFAYDLTLNDANLAPGDRLTVNAGQATSAAVDGSTEELGAFTFIGSGGDDGFAGGGQADKFLLQRGGTDRAEGHDGDDVYKMRGSLDPTDSLNGGDDFDKLILRGDYSAGLVLGATTMTSFAQVIVRAGHDYNITTNDANIIGLFTMTAQSLDAGDTLTFDASAETDSVLGVSGGKGDDVIRGGEAGDSFNLGEGADTLIYTTSGQSSNSEFDSLIDWNFDEDQLNVFVDVTSIATAASGDVDFATFDADIGTAINDALVAGSAILVTATGGDLVHDVFLVVECGGSDTFYQAGVDLVIKVAGFTGTLDTGAFI